MISYGDQRQLLVHIQPSGRPLPNTPQNTQRTITPDFILLRGTQQSPVVDIFVTPREPHQYRSRETGGCRGDFTQDHKNKLLSISHSNMPCINCIDSFLWSQVVQCLLGLLPPFTL